MMPGQLQQSCQTLTPIGQCTSCIGRILNICRPLDDRQLAELVALGDRRRWRKRDILFRAGDPVTVFFKITKGTVAVSRVLEDGRRQIVAIRIAGDCVGYLHTDGCYTFEGHAITDVEACTFSRRRFDDLARQYPDLAAATSNALARAQMQASDLVTAIGQLRSTERTAYFFAEIHALYEARLGDTRTISIGMNRSEIADYLGLTIETVSRSIAKLKKRSLIALTTATDVEILDVKELRRFAKFQHQHVH